MKVDEQVREVWDAVLDYGDIQKISDEKNVDPRQVSAARKDGVCTEKVFNAINDFVAEKKARIEQSAKKVTE